MKTPLALLVLLSVSQVAFAQSDDEGKVIAELKEQLAQLKSENAELRKMVAKQEELHAKRQTEFAQMQHKLELEKAQVHKLAQLESDLKADFSARDQAMLEHAAMLQDQLNHLREEEAALRNLSGSLESARTMADRLASAKIENRMSMLQSQAMLRALESFSKKKQSESNALSQLAAERAKLLIEQRRTEYEMLRDLSQRTKDNDARTKYRAQLEVAMLGIKEAELLSEEAKLTAAQAAKGVDDRVAEAALNLAIAEQMEAYLQHEMEKIHKMLRSSAQLDELAARKDALQAELLDIETAARQRKQAFTAEKVKLEMEKDALHNRLDLLAAERNEVTKKLGKEHPVVIQLEEQISVLEEHLNKLKK